MLHIAGIAASDAEVLGYTGACDVMLVSTGLLDDSKTDFIARVLNRDPEINVLVVGLAKTRHLILVHYSTLFTGRSPSRLPATVQRPASAVRRRAVCTPG